MNDPDFLPEAFLLDMDGVLVHSQEAHLRAYDRAFSQQGLIFPSEARELVRRGMSRERVLAEADVPEAMIPLISDAKEEAFLELVARGELLPAEGVGGFLSAVRGAGLPMAVVSNSAIARPCLQALGIGDAFQTVVDGTMAANPKPSPDPWLLAASRLGVSPERCVVIEDSPTGARGARAAGTFVVGVGSGLTPSQVDAHFPNLASIPLRRWLGGSLSPHAPV